MSRVAVLGLEGMLGRIIVNVINQQHQFIEFNRNGVKTYSSSSKAIRFNAPNAFLKFAWACRLGKKLR